MLLSESHVVNVYVIIQSCTWVIQLRFLIESSWKWKELEVTFIFNPPNRAKSSVGANFPQQNTYHVFCTKLMYYIVCYVTTFFDAVKPW